MTKSAPRPAARLLIHLATLAACAALIGCESSPLAQDYSDHGSARYMESLVARSIVDGNYHGNLVQAPTVAGGVHEFGRVDSPGPGAVAPPDLAPRPTQAVTSIPESHEPEDLTTPPNLSDEPPESIGLAAATLNQTEPVFNLSLQEAIARAMKNSLAIKVEAYNPAISEAKIIEAESVFDAVLGFTSNWSSTDEPQLQLGGITNGQLWQNQLSVKRLLPSGGTASAFVSDNYRNIADPVPLGVPKETQTASIGVTVTQPLLRGFGTDITEANIHIARRDYRISLATFKRQVITTASAVEEAYHNVVLARTIVDINEQLLAATATTQRRVWDRRHIDADNISVNQSIAAVQQRRADLIRSRSDLRTASDRLKSLLNDPEISIHSNILINPTDKPIADPIAVSTAECIETALRQRTEIQELRLQLERADIVITGARNDLLPRLDMTVSAQSTALDNSFENAFNSTVNPGKSIDYAVGVKLEFPIGNRLAEATLSRRLAERTQVITGIVSKAQDVVFEVKQQLRNVLESYQEIQARELARISAEKELQAIISKENIVTLSPEFLQLKLDSQSRLAAAENALINAIVSYNISIMKLEQAKGTLLEFDRISLDRPPVKNDDAGAIRLLGQSYPLANLKSGGK